MHFDNLKVWDITDLSLPPGPPAAPLTSIWSPLRSFPAPTGGSSNIVRVVDSLWVINSRDRRLYRLDLEGNITTEVDFSIPCERAAWDGESLWCTHMGKSIQKLDPVSGQKLAEFEVDMGDIRGIAWDGFALWVIDQDSSLAHYDRDGQRLRRLAVPVDGWPIAMTWAETELWVVDVHGELTRFDAEFEAVDSFGLGQCGAGPFPYDLTLYWDGEGLWLADANQNRIINCTPAD